MTITLILLGFLAGAGIWIAAAALVPDRPALAPALKALDVRPATPAATGSTLGRGFVGWLIARGLPASSVRKDLATLDMPTDAFVARQVITGVAGLCLPWMLGLVLVLTGSGGWIVPIWLGLIGGLLGFLAPAAALHTRAERARDEYRDALAIYLDLVAIAVSGAAGIDQALNQAARAGSGPRFAQIQRALHTAHLTRQNPWEALSDLGRRIGVSEYEQLAATIGLAGTEGARVRASLTARAQT